MTVTLRRNPYTGKMDVIGRIDTDSLPVERGQMHRALVEMLIAKDSRPEVLGEFIVEHKA